MVTKPVDEVAVNTFVGTLLPFLDLQSPQHVLAAVHAQFHVESGTTSCLLSGIRKEFEVILKWINSIIYQRLS